MIGPTVESLPTGIVPVDIMTNATCGQLDDKISSGTYFKTNIV